MQVSTDVLLFEDAAFLLRSQAAKTYCSWNELPRIVTLSTLQKHSGGGTPQARDTSHTPIAPVLMPCLLNRRENAD